MHDIFTIHLLIFRGGGRVFIKIFKRIKNFVITRIFFLQFDAFKVIYLVVFSVYLFRRQNVSPSYNFGTPEVIWYIQFYLWPMFPFLCCVIFSVYWQYSQSLCCNVRSFVLSDSWHCLQTWHNSWSSSIFFVQKSIFWTNGPDKL